MPPDWADAAALVIWESLTTPAREALTLPPWTAEGRRGEWAQMIRLAERADAHGAKVEAIVERANRKARSCAKCHGTGRVFGGACSECQGSGKSFT